MRKILVAYAGGPCSHGQLVLTADTFADAVAALQLVLQKLPLLV